MFLAIPHRVTTSSIEVFLGAFSGDEPPTSAQLNLKWHGGSKHLPIADVDWTSLLGDGAAEIHYCKRTFEGLDPGTTYELELIENNTALATGRAETLPTSLPVGDNGGGTYRPFTIWLSSCFFAPLAPSGLDEMVRRVVRDAHSRPHLKVLAGDQVYLDFPQTKTMFFGTSRLRRHFNEVYTTSWTQPAFAELLSSCASYFLGDDHEVWDNFPDNPFPFAWALRRRGFWKTWERLALERCSALQSVRPTQQIDIGPSEEPELSISWYKRGSSARVARIAS